MCRAREARHVSANLRHNGDRRDRPDSRNGLQQFQRFLVRGKTTLNLGLQLRDGLLQEVNVREGLTDHDKVMGLDAARKGFTQLR